MGSDRRKHQYRETDRRQPDPPAAEPPTLDALVERVCRGYGIGTYRRTAGDPPASEGSIQWLADEASRLGRDTAYSRVLEKIAEMRLALHGGTPAWSFDAEEELGELKRAVEALQKGK